MARHAFYKLALGTIEIDGVRMHRTAGVTPLQSAREMVSLLALKPGEKVLDVCTGLGYTAIEEAGAGAQVTTIEVDEQVLALARQNPASGKLFEKNKIKIISGDASELIRSLPANSLDAVLHDPPRFSFAGELYSGAFYAELFRVLKPGGRLFHYTGRPGEKSGRSFTKGVKQRLEAAGFVKVAWVEPAQGFLAFKQPTKNRVFQ